MLVQSGLDKVITLGGNLHIHSRTVAGPVTLIEDAFTDTDGTALTAHTIAPTNTPGVSWVYTGGCSIQSNKASTSGGGIRSSVDTGAANVTVTAVLGNILTGIIARLTDDTHYWLGYFDATTVYVYEVNGGYTIRASTGGAFAVGGTMQVVTSGQNITATYGGVSPTYASTYNQTATKHGFYSDGNGHTFDNFKVTTP